MIKTLAYSNFKCLDRRNFALSKLNILSGYNGRGKSSVIQSLLLLSQSAEIEPNLSKLHIGGKLTDLGTFSEIQTQESNSQIFIDFTTDDSRFSEVSLGYKYVERDAKVGALHKCNINGADYFDTVGGLTAETAVDSKQKILSRAVPDGLISYLKGIYYVSADRRGPVKYEDIREVPEIYKVLPKGENSINTIKFYSESIDESMNLHADGKRRTLHESASEWLDYIMNGGSISVPGASSDKILSIAFGISPKGDKSFSSYNVGFGYSYVLAIILTALIAKKESLVIIENPEAHLHGQAQSRLTQLFAKLADRGVQLIIETHSEHIVNGVRLEVLRNNCGLAKDDVAIYFFDENFSIKPLKIENNGRIKNWPRGFFDQETFDLAEIIRLGAAVK